VTLKVRLLGRPRIEDADGRPGQPARGQKSWALLARVALAGRSPTRAELAAELFGEADDPLGALRWSLADLRRCGQNPQLLRGDPVRVSDQELWIDVRALMDGTLPAAEIGGTLLDGVAVRNCPAFDLWLMLTRGRCAARSAEELRRAALSLLGTGDAEAAIEPAGRAAGLDPLDEGAQELLLRVLVAAGHPARAAVHLSRCQDLFAREGLTPSPALRAAALASGPAPPAGLRAGVVAWALLRAGKAALDAGSADAGVETLRQAAQEARRARDPQVLAEVLAVLGSALVHAVRGRDGEGAVVLNQALAAARAAGQPGLAADILRELAFVDLQAGRHASAARALAEASGQAASDPALLARILATQGMNEADQGRHDAAVRLLARSARTAATAGHPRQQAWSAGVMARSLLLAGQVEQARQAAEESIAICERERWPAFVPWPQALRAHCLEASGRQDEARDDAEQAFALACQLGDPCWEGIAGRALAVLALRRGDDAGARRWITDAQQRCDRLPDRWVWVSGFVSLGHLEIAAKYQPDLVLPLARSVAAGVVSPALHARLAALGA
jgi:DNA-binding SARP family transcriptional activator